MHSDSEESLAVAVFREDGVWRSTTLPVRVSDDLAGLVTVLRTLPADGGTIGLVNVADEFFVAARVRGERVQLLLSDVTAAAAWDLARQVVVHLAIDVPNGDDMDDVWPAGDLSIFDDLGVDEMELGALLSDIDAYADEMLVTLAKRLGFADAYASAIDAAMN